MHLVQHPGHHRLAVGARVVLRPRHRFDVVVEQRLAFHEEREIAVGHVEAQHAMRQLLARPLDEVAADQIPGAARTRVQHRPHRIFLVETDFDEVVAAAERTDLLVELVGADLAMPGLDRVQPFDQPRLRDARFDAVRQLAVVAALAVANGHAAFDRVAQLRQRVGKILRPQRGAHCGHAAADVHADRRRDDRAAGRDHRSHGRALAQMYVGHHRDPGSDEWDRSDVAQLLVRFRFERHATHPALDRRGALVGVQKLE